jgi:hypothetical protein
MVQSRHRRDSMQGKRLALPTKKEFPFGSGYLFIGVRFGQAFGLTYMRSVRFILT